MDSLSDTSAAQSSDLVHDQNDALGLGGSACGLSYWCVLIFCILLGICNTEFFTAKLHH